MKHFFVYMLPWLFLFIAPKALGFKPNIWWMTYGVFAAVISYAIADFVTEL